MKQKLAHGIVRYRLWILLALLAAAAFSATAIGKTNINYDLNRYLSQDTMTKRALKVMEEEFGSSEQLRLMFTDIDEETLREITDALQALPEVRIAAHDPEKDARARDGHVYQLVTLALNSCDETALVMRLRGMFPQAGPYAVGGPAASTLDLQTRVAQEIPLVMAVSVGIVVLVLLLTSHAWLEPAVLLLVLAVSILINMGTNFIFESVSFITFAVCAILQLALSIDYAIMLLHAWNACLDSGMGAEKAMEEALRQCFMRIFSSAMTTAAGLLSLLFMSFTIGFDIGLVLSKGIFISMAGVFLMMPAVTLLLEKPLRLTRHKPLSLGGQRLAGAIGKIKKPLAVVLILAVIGGAYLNTQTRYSFSSDGGMAGSETAAVNDVFGASNPLVLLVPGGDEDEDYALQRALVQRLEAIQKGDGAPALGEIAAMVTTGQAALEEYSAKDAAKMIGMSPLLVNLFFRAKGFGETVRADRLLDEAGALAADNEVLGELQAALSDARAAFQGPRYARLLLNVQFQPSDPDFYALTEQIMAAAEATYGNDYYVTGLTMSSYDIGNAFRGDLLRVNLITLLAIFLIVAAAFRSIRLPLLLVFVIEGAIWITMGLSRLLDQSIFFMAYLICLAIQMGATIDYGILLCDQYRAHRRAGASKEQALADTLRKSLPTVLTSGLILITAGFVVGSVCTVSYISDIGYLLSRGALISVLLVLTLLPALLLWADRFLIKERR